MMFRTNIKYIIFPMIVIYVIFGVTKISLSSIIDDKNILILYDLENYYGDNRNSTKVIENLFIKFDYKVSKYQIDDFDQTLDSYEKIVVFLNSNSFENDILKKDLQEFKGEILWIGNGINILDTELRDKGKVNNLIRVIYKNNYYDLGVRRYFRIVDVPSDAKVYSELYDGENYYPFIVKHKNILYVSRLDLNEPLFFIFIDVLYDFLKVEPSEKTGIYFRIQDINPYTNEEKLKETIDYFISKNIPFALSVIPIYREKGSKFRTLIREKQELIKVIKYGIDNGGTLIMQGGHQYFSKTSITGEDFFEWKNKNDGEVSDWVDEIMNEALLEMSYNELYPSMFDTKHFVLDKTAYLEMSKYFDTIIGWTQDADWVAKYTIYPYTLKNIYGFKTYIPENLTIDKSNESYAFQNLDERIDRISITRNYLAGIAISSEIEVSELDDTIKFIKNREISYLDLKTFDTKVTSEIYDLEQINGKINVIVKKIEGNSIGRIVFRSLSYIIILFLVFIVILFGITFEKSRIKTRHKLFKEN